MDSGRSFEFGRFRFSTRRKELTRNGAVVPLGSRALDILAFLLDHAGRTVGRGELIAAIWPDRVVEENNLTVHISAIRHALGEGADGTRFIHTDPGRGYRLVVPVTETMDPSAEPAIGHSPEQRDDQPATTSRATLSVQEKPSIAAMPPAPLRETIADAWTQGLIGRDTTLAELRRLLGTRRLVTIVGPGGVGKTSVALRLAADLAREFPDGVAFADLSAVTDPARVAEVVVAVLAAGAGDNAAMERLTGFLRDRQVLLVLDNCEHLVEPVAALVTEILAACARVVILATSREGLLLHEEQVFRLPPLPFPNDPGAADAVTALTFDAVRLFAVRAATLNGFALTDAAAPTVATICARLDGIPLAIEMAVPRLKVLSLSQLSERLDERFRLLAMPGRDTTPRHRTLRAMIDWSYDFLPKDEQALLRALSVFSGGADLAAIHAVTGTEDADEFVLLDRLTGLVDKSLLTVDTAGRARFRLLDTIRQYAAGKLLDAGEEAASRFRHATYFADRFAEAAEIWPATPGPAWLAAYAQDTDNLRAAISWAYGPDGDPATGHRLVASSVPLWWELPETPLAEGQRWFDAAAKRLGAQDRVQHEFSRRDHSIRGWVRLGQSWRDFRFGDLENLSAAKDAIDLFRSSDDAIGLGAALWRAGSAVLSSETTSLADEYLTEAESILRGVVPGKWLALTLIRLGDLRFRQGRHAESLANYQEGAALSRRVEFWIGLVNSGSNMANLLFALGETKRALGQLRELCGELPRGRRTPLMATLTAHLLLAGETEEMNCLLYTSRCV